MVDDILKTTKKWFPKEVLENIYSFHFQKSFKCAHCKKLFGYFIGMKHPSKENPFLKSKVRPANDLPLMRVVNSEESKPFISFSHSLFFIKKTQYVPRWEKTLQERILDLIKHYKPHEYIHIQICKGCYLTHAIRHSQTLEMFNKQRSMHFNKLLCKYPSYQIIFKSCSVKTETFLRSITCFGEGTYLSMIHARHSFERLITCNPNFTYKFFALREELNISYRVEDSEAIRYRTYRCKYHPFKKTKLVACLFRYVLSPTDGFVARVHCKEIDPSRLEDTHDEDGNIDFCVKNVYATVYDEVEDYAGVAYTRSELRDVLIDGIDSTSVEWEAYSTTDLGWSCFWFGQHNLL